jgi:hypothetical protein
MNDQDTTGTPTMTPAPQTATFAKVLEKYGLATVLALFFVWWVTSDLSGSVRAIQDTLTEHISESAYYMRQICLNTAQDESQRAACIAPRAH